MFGCNTENRIRCVRNLSLLTRDENTLDSERKFRPLSCDLCNVQMGSPLTAKRHYNGKPHEKEVKSFLAEWSKKTSQSILSIPIACQSSNLFGAEVF